MMRLAQRTLSRSNTGLRGAADTLATGCSPFDSVISRPSSGVTTSPFAIRSPRPMRSLATSPVVFAVMGAAGILRPEPPRRDQEAVGDGQRRGEGTPEHVDAMGGRPQAWARGAAVRVQVPDRLPHALSGSNGSRTLPAACTGRSPTGNVVAVQAAPPAAGARTGIASCARDWAWSAKSSSACRPAPWSWSANACTTGVVAPRRPSTIVGMTRTAIGANARAAAMRRRHEDTRPPSLGASQPTPERRFPFSYPIRGDSTSTWNVRTPPTRTSSSA
jgi:hypothetical protein